MRQVVIEPRAELVGEEQHDGNDQPGDEDRKRRRLRRTEYRNEQIGNAVTQHLVGNERPAENDSEQEKVEIEIAEVGQARPAPYDVSGE